VKKKEKAILITGIVVLCCCTSAMSFFTGRFVEMERTIEMGTMTPNGLLLKSYDKENDAWTSVDSIKILCIPWSVEYGEQFDNILVDEIIAENGVIYASPNFGFININKTTGMMQLYKWE